MTLPPMARLHPRWPLTDASRALKRSGRQLPRRSSEIGGRSVSSPLCRSCSTSLRTGNQA